MTAMVMTILFSVTSLRYRKTQDFPFPAIKMSVLRWCWQEIFKLWNTTSQLDQSASK